MRQHTFKPILSEVNFPELEERVIAYWKKNKIFEKSIEARPADKTWTFLDGPPFITGLPHYGSLLSSIAKDLFPRFWTMKGYRVRRVWGWDCHGLPAENKVEEKLGLKRKKDIEEKVGVEKFIQECKLYVENVSGEWEWYVDHVGRWVDFAHAYKTMDLPYMETVMWVFRQMYDKGYIYKGLRVSLYCPHCATPISNFEVAMDADNYKEVTESGTIYKYELQASIKLQTFLLAWSTTPWNKLVTPALAVNPELTYVKVKQGEEYYILAESALKILKDEPYEVIERFQGSNLLGKKFIPHYDFYSINPGKKAFEIVAGEFVTEDEGTGIVTIAAYGEEDLALMQRENIQIVVHLDEEGRLKSDVPNWAGMYYLDVNPLVNQDLKNRGLLYRDDPYTHTVPTCWRCHTRLIYAPQDAWYVNVQTLKSRLRVTNEKVDWYPSHFKYGRYLKSLESAPDWCISRSRYWGSPVPVWECGCGERFVPGSIEELEKASKAKITDLHKPLVDEITVTCKKCGSKVHRVPEVLDSWIEAGSASFAERHFPFEKDIKLENFFPPDFIVEYTGQIRAWFYVLHVIATALYDSHAFKNVVVTGVILGTDGRKMSKNLRNYPDPKEMITKYGGDALRLYLMGNPVMHAEDIRISEEQYRNQVRGILLIYWNVYKFFINNAIVDKWSPDRKKVNLSNHVLDRWILSRLRGNIENMTLNGYEKFDTPEVVGQVWIFMNDLSLWFVRRSRKRVGPTATDILDKKQAYQTLWFILKDYTKALSPLIPFISEEVYRNLTGEISVHLTNWPNIDQSFSDPKLEAEMDDGRKIASLVHSLRKQSNVSVRIPLKKLSYSGPRELTEEIKKVILDEVNIYELNYKGEAPEFTLAGEVDKTNQDIISGQARDLIRQIQMLRRLKECKIDERVTVQLPMQYKSLSRQLLDLVQKETLADKLLWGESLQLSSSSTLQS